MTEIWKPIAWAPGYEVSNKGRVRSVDREVFITANRIGVKRRPAHQRVRKGKVLALSVERYAYVGILRRKAWVHQLVAEAFLGPRPDGHIVCHGPGGPLDNRVENLSWGTYSKNLKEDRLRDGTLPLGSRNTSAKLNEAQVIEIKRRTAAGESRASLARAFGVRPETISHIALGRNWSWLEVG
jgi:hypothetical protein